MIPSDSGRTLILLVRYATAASHLLRVDCDEVVEDDRQHCQHAESVREVVKSVVADHFRSELQCEAGE